MPESLSADYLPEEEPAGPFDRRGFWEGVIIGAAAFVFVAAFRAFLESHVNPPLSIDIAPQAFSSCYRPGSLPLPDSWWILFLWWLHLGLVQPLLLPATTAPSVPYLGLAIVFLIALLGLLSSSRGIRRTWITLGGILLMIYVGVMLVYLLIVSTNICD
ncbi:MAG: hypothetical protein JXA21_28370 [Anaerolineae bacterium]|nr:hypothetical protein [Anaerolineae bacterium]